ncbi:MAG: thiamine pyrophosphate-binding protein [Elusimicrobiota bacterium]
MSTKTIPAIRLLLRYLEQEGVEYIFGIPGGPIISLYEALYDRQVIKPILTKHEGGAAFMADGYARVSGKIGVCCTTTGPGATNALTGVAVAFADHIPLLILTAQVPTHHFGKGAFQESSPESVDMVGLYRPVTKWSTMIQHPDSTAFTIRKALRLLTNGRPGPVHINLPCNFATQPVPDELLPSAQYRFPSRTFDRTAVKQAARQLAGARRPVILAGHGVSLARAWGPLRELAERFQIPVATTFKAKGGIPEDHALSLGVFGPSGSARTREYVADPETDVLLAAGTSLGEVSSCGWDERLAQKRALLQLDIDSAEIGRNYPVDVALIGDAGAVLTELRFQLERDFQNGPIDALRRRTVLPPCPPDAPDASASQERALKPRRVLRELREALPRNAILFVDNGTIRTWAGQHFPVYQEGCFFVNMGMASMGYAVAGSIGGQLAAPKRLVVALVGDAAFAMNGMEVHTAVEHDVPVIWVVVNNGGHGMIYHGEKMLYKGKFRSSIFRQRLKIQEIAKAMGAKTFLVERPGEVGPVMLEAIALRSPCVIEVTTDLHEVPPMGARVQAIQRELAAA